MSSRGSDSDGDSSDTIDTTDNNDTTDNETLHEKLIIRIPNPKLTTKTNVKEERSRVCTFLELRGGFVACCRCHTVGSIGDVTECDGPCLGSADRQFLCACFGVPGPSGSDLSSQFHPPSNKDDAESKRRRKQIEDEEKRKEKSDRLEAKRVRDVAERSVKKAEKLFLAEAKNRERAEEKDAAAAAKSKHMLESRQYVARAANMPMVQCLREEASLKFRSTLVGRLKFGASPDSATSSQLRALNDAIRKPLGEAIIAHSTMNPRTLAGIAPQMIKNEGPPSARNLSVVDEKVLVKFENAANFTADYRGRGGGAAAKLPMAPPQALDELDDDELMVTGVVDCDGRVSFSIDEDQAHVLRTPKRARSKSASSSSEFSSGGSSSSTSSGLSSDCSSSSSSSGVFRGAERSPGLKERLIALRDCFNSGLLSESEFNEQKEKALNFI